MSDQMREMFSYTITTIGGNGDEIAVQVSVSTNGRLSDAIQGFGMILNDESREDLAANVLTKMLETESN